MPSAKRADFFRCKQLQEKIGVKVRSFIGLCQSTRTDFLSQTKNSGYPTIFFHSVISRTQTDFLSELLCLTMAGEVLLLNYVTPIFTGLKSAHTDRFLTQTNCRKEGTDFLSDQKSGYTNRFLIYEKKHRSEWAGHYQFDL